MNRYWQKMNPTLRGLLLIALVVVLIMVLNLYVALATVGLLVRLAFFLAIAFFIYLLWRERREEINAWSPRSRVAFYGGALLIVADLGAFFWRRPAGGLQALAFVLVLALSAFSMWRAWRDEHTYA